MIRLTAGLVLRMDRSYLIILILGFFMLTTVGCIGGVNIVPLSAKIQNADDTFDKAEAVSTQSDDPEKKAKAKSKQQQLYDKAIMQYLEIIARDVDGKYAQRSHYQIAMIYKRFYEWDKANDHYQAIIELDPTGYYANEAKSGIAKIHNNRELIQQQRAKYQNFKALYEAVGTDESYNTAAESLYTMAQAFETLENYTEAIATFEKMAKEFQKHPKAVQAQFQVGNIYFYKLYDYTNSGGWGAFVKVAQDFPDTFEAEKVKSLLIKTQERLVEIKQLQDEIQRNKSKKAIEFEKLDRYVLPSDRWIQGKTDLIVQNFERIAQNWEALRNFPNAIETYKVLARDISHKKFAVANALYKIGSLYQQSGQYERAIKAYQDLFDNAAESSWRNEAVYQQAICYRAIREFGKAYQGFKDYVSLTKGDRSYLREAEQIVRQYELDLDEDGYLFYVELESGTSDQDPNSYPGATQ